MMSWKSLQDWAQRVWAKHYPQSPIGSTQNVRPVIVEGAPGAEYISSAVENCRSGQNAPTNEAETYFGCHDNLQHITSVSQWNEELNVATQPANRSSLPTNQNKVSNIATQPANRSSTLQNEVSNIATQPANRSSLPANQNVVSNVAVGRGSGHVCCHGDSVNRLNFRNQLDVQSPIERDLLAAARHRERLSMQARLEQTPKRSNKSCCKLRRLLIEYTSL